SVCFLFQAEDGIRGLTVTGVQTCALPILSYRGGYASFWRMTPGGSVHYRSGSRNPPQSGRRETHGPSRPNPQLPAAVGDRGRTQIGRASCRERGEIAWVRASLGTQLYSSI